MMMLRDSAAIMLRLFLPAVQPQRGMPKMIRWRTGKVNEESRHGYFKVEGPLVTNLRELVLGCIGAELIFQESIHVATFFEIQTIDALLHRSKLKMFVQIWQSARHIVDQEFPNLIGRIVAEWFAELDKFGQVDKLDNSHKFGRFDMFN